jgi:phage-related protein (TIGR01555 family)
VAIPEGMSEASNVEPASPAEAVDRRLIEHTNSLGEYADFCAQSALGQMGPFGMEPTISTPLTMIGSADYGTFTLNRTALNYVFKSFGLVRSFIRQPIDDGMRGGLIVEIPELDDPKALEDLGQAIDDADDMTIAKDTATWARLFGGAGLIAATDQDPSTPFNPERFRKGGNLAFVAADRWELTMSGLALGPDSISRQIDKVARAQFGFLYPEANFLYYDIPMDPSRVTRMLGQTAPSMVRQKLQGWGLSELEQCIREINTFIKLQNLCFELVDEAKVDVYKIKKFNTLLGSAQGLAQAKLRVALSNIIKNYQNSVVMDTEDEYEQKQIAFSGLAQLFQEFRINLCAALRIPMNKLFGMSASGFASGEDSMENYNAMVEVEVRDKMKRMLRTIVGLRCRQLFGYEPRFKLKFHPLRVLNAVDEEIVKTSKQDRALGLYDRDQIDGMELAEILRKEGCLIIDTKVGNGEREPISAMELQKQESDAKAAAAKNKPGKSAKERRDNAREELRRVLGRREPVWGLAA